MTRSHSLCLFTYDVGVTVRVKQEPGSRSTGEPPAKRLKTEDNRTSTVSKQEGVEDDMFQSVVCSFVVVVIVRNLESLLGVITLLFQYFHHVV